MRFSILHISDLHRDLKDEIPNNWLLDSLSRDFGQFDIQDPKILKPSICIVSGDLVYGASTNPENADAELRRQYIQAEEFLVGLADRFFAGDRECIIILPGNHDVCFSDVIISLKEIKTPVDPESKKALVAEIFEPNTRLRWSWKNLCFFEIINETKYSERFRYFSEMYEHFYQGRRKFSSADEEQYQIFDFSRLGFSVITLNSCYNNDPFHTQGSIHPYALTEACRAIQKVERRGWLAAASWHHNIVGSPSNNDYLDSEFIQPLIDAGVSIGFHGHQNRSDCFDERYRFGQNLRKITVISASTLCAEPHNLKPGIPRSYNLIEIDTDKWTGRLHQRQMVNSQFNMPVWGAGHFTATGSSFIDFDVCPPLLKRSAELEIQLTLERADSLLGFSKYGEALIILEPVKNNPRVRPFLMRALEELGDTRRIIVTLWPPQNEKEVVILGGALLEIGSDEEIKNFTQLNIVANNHDGSVREILRRVSERCKK